MKYDTWGWEGVLSLSPLLFPRQELFYHSRRWSGGKGGRGLLLRSRSLFIFPEKWLRMSLAAKGEERTRNTMPQTRMYFFSQKRWEDEASQTHPLFALS